MAFESLTAFMQRNRWLLVLWYGVSVLLFIAGCVTLAMGSVRLAAETRVEGSNAVSYYFTASSTLVKYTDVQDDYAKASKKLHSEFLRATKTDSGSIQHRHRLRTISSEPESLIVLGISAFVDDSIIVLGSFLFSGGNAPNASTIRDAINSLPQTSLLNMIGNADTTTSSSHSPLCQLVGGSAQNATAKPSSIETTEIASSELTTSSTANSSVTSIPVNSSSRNTTNQNSSQAVTLQPQIVATRPSSSGRTHRTAGPKICLTSESPPVASTSETASTALSSTTSLLGITTATAMPTSLINATDLSPMANTAGETTAAEAATGSSTITTYLQGMSSSAQTTSTVSTTPAVDKPSCNPLDVVISFDTSTSSGKQNFVRQTEFVGNVLTANWSIGENATELALSANNPRYSVGDDMDFKYPGNHEFSEDVRHFSCYPLHGKGSINNQIEGIKMKLWNSRKRSRQVAIVFTYSSLYSDVARAATLAGYSRTLPKLVIVAMGTGVDVHLLKAITGSVISADQFDQKLAAQINSELCSPRTPRGRLPAFVPATQAPPSNKTTTQSIARATTRYPMPATPQNSNLTCSPNVAIVMDASNATGTADIHQQTDFVEQHLVSHWIVSEDGVWMAVYASGLENYRSGSHIYTHLNNAQVYTDLRALASAGWFGENCIDCAINLVLKDSYPVYERTTTIVFTYASEEPDLTFAREDVGALNENHDSKFIIVGIGENVNGTALQTLTKNVLLASELDEALAAKIRKEICSADLDDDRRSSVQTLKATRQSK